MHSERILSLDKHEDRRSAEKQKLFAGSFGRAPWVSSKEVKGAPAAQRTSNPSSKEPQCEVSFKWLKAGLAAKDVASGEGITSVDSHREPALALSMVFVEGASTRPSYKSLKGWEIVKSGMDYVLGRSIVPATKHKLSGTLHSSAKNPSSPSTITHLSAPSTNALTSQGHGLERASQGRSLDSASHRHSLDNKNCLAPLPNCRDTRHCSRLLASAEVTKGIAKQLHFFKRDAVSGALAGMCVSLCLHPIDTVKTVIQSQSFGNRSVFHTLLGIISQRGFLGLYRGLGSNLASSGPISAIYTFTYESVKAALLPHLPKEYHAIAHCTAGGCASIATSIVFTPSECVKQRMQVGSLHGNSWLTFLAILKNGGLSVLYSGWIAVLCRNVPQSVIKFYTYEGLKHCALSEKPNGTPLSAYQTLAFGGLAGCTAALFTTPFDVIKTRLQTQMPGSVLHQKGVLRLFQHIAASEGIGGLYRGLIPRLVIYLSQGALFFASYEFFKQLLEMEVPKLTVFTCHSTEMVAQSKFVEPT